MSELDTEIVGIVDDGQTKDTTEVIDEKETSTMTAKQTGNETLRIQLRLFLELFSTDKNELVLVD